MDTPTDEMEPGFTTPSWQVLHVRPRCEKKCAEYLGASHVDYYLPLREETKIYQRRKVTVEKPLFPSYVFTQFAPLQRVHVLKSQMVIRIISVENQTRLLMELDQIRTALAVNPILGSCPAVTQGTPVRIKSGPFQGLEGVVCTVKGETRVVLNVEMIGQGVPVEVGLDMLERL